ncbi:MAG: hypothetical protein WC261_14950 [Synergistaceae bacterium]
MAWKAIEVPACLLFWRDTDSDHPHFTASDEVLLNAGPVTCHQCGDVIRYDSRGYAFCNCTIWNDGKPFGEMKNEIQRHTKHFLRKISQA